MALVANIDTLLRIADGELGTAESPSYSNRQKYGVWYGMNGVPWCAIFVSWVFDRAGYKMPRIPSSKGLAYVPDIVNWARANGAWTSTPQRGYLVVFSMGGKRADHVGFVRRVLSDGRVETVEGNTDGTGSRTGGRVARLNRRARILGYVKVVNPSGGSKPKPPPVPTTPPISDLEDEEDMAVYHRSSVFLDADDNIVDAGAPGAHQPAWVFYGERYRRISRTHLKLRMDLAAFSGKKIELHSTHPWVLADFVTRYNLIEDPR